MNLVLFVAGLAALVAGATLLVRGASQLALTWGVSPLVVGLTIVAFGTSAPEVAVSVGAALDGRADIAVGNVVGSNIFNVLFILGVSALIVPLAVDRQLIRQEVPVMIGASLLLLSLMLDRVVGRIDGALLLALLGVYTVFLVVQSRRRTTADAAPSGATVPAPAAGDEGLPTRATGWSANPVVLVLFVVAGLALLVVGSNWLVDASIAFARALGVSDAVIGLTIVAAGTSMPEVATSITAAIRGERDIAVGNVVGSNTFNILGCLGLSGVVAPDGLPVAASILNFDAGVMLVVAFACLPIFLSGREIARWEGGLFVAYYVAYTLYLILASQQHDALPAFSQAMLGFAIPLTVVTLTVVAIRR